MESSPSTRLKAFEIPVFSNYILDATRGIKSDTDIYIGRTIDSNEEVVFKLKKIYNSDHIYINKEFKIYKELEGIKRIPKLYLFPSFI